jgi:CheY-specific phosphatase CheX
MQVMRTPTTLSTEFQSKPNALRSNILDVDSVGGMNEHIKQKIKQIEKKQQNTAATTLQTAVRGKKARGIIRTEVAKQEANDLASQIMDGSFNDLEQIFQKDILKLMNHIKRLIQTKASDFV